MYYFFRDLKTNHPTIIKAAVIIIPNAHPPSSSFICCQRVSSFSTGYGTFTSLITVTSLDGRYTVSGSVRIFANRFPRLSMVSCACAFLLLAISSQDSTTFPFSSHSSSARMVALSGGSCTSTSFSTTMLSVLLSIGTYLTLRQDQRAEIKKKLNIHFISLQHFLQHYHINLQHYSPMLQASLILRDLTKMIIATPILIPHPPSQLARHFRPG